jgi:hypothetical protein
MSTNIEDPAGRPAAAAHDAPNGAALAAILAAGIGSFAVGVIVLLDAAGVVSVPSLYGPSGGVSGRTTLAVVSWLVAWAMLHLRWRTGEVLPGRVYAITLILIVLGVLGTFPPLWDVF